MSKTTTIAYGNRWFWSYDLARSVLLVEVIKVARRSTEQGPERWKGEVLDDLRLCAEIGDLELTIDPAWDEQRLDTLVAWLEAANRSLERRTEVRPEETGDWPLEQFEWRGTDPVPTASVISLGGAVIQLIRGTLPAEPPGRVWYYGFTAEPSLLPG